MAVIHNPNLVTNGLVSLWDAGNRVSYPAAGTAWTDLAGASDGTLTNGPTFSSDISGNIVLDNTDDYIALSPNVSIAADSDVTFCIWVKPTAWTGASPGLWRSDSDSRGRYEMGFSSTTGRPYIKWRNVNLTVPGSGYAVPLDAWVYVVFVASYLSTTPILMYADGELKHSIAKSGGNTEAFDVYSIGFQYATNQRVTGGYSMFSFYNRLLSAEEIVQNYNAMKGRFGL